VTAPLDTQVAERVAALCLDRRGRLSPLLICATAVRAGLLVDLARDGRLSETPDSISLDDAPTGSPAADLLLHDVRAHPGTALDGWLDRPRPVLRDVAGEAVEAGRWELRRGLHLRPRFQAADPGQAATDRARDPAGDTGGWTPDDAAVTAIAWSAGLLRLPRTANPVLRGTDPLPAAALDAGGSLRWLLATVAGHLAETRQRYVLQSMALHDGIARPS